MFTKVTCLRWRAYTVYWDIVCIHVGLEKGMINKIDEISDGKKEKEGPQL